MYATQTLKLSEKVIYTLYPLFFSILCVSLRGE